jgi:hypothetical protein
MGRFTIPKKNNQSPYLNEYYGSFLDNKFHGKGKIINELGVMYEGDWLYGKKEGYGKLIIPKADQNIFSEKVF